MLQQGSQLAGAYNKVTAPELQKILQSLWTPADKYATPPEAKHQLCSGLLSNHEDFNRLRGMLEACALEEVCIGKTLGEALQEVDRHMTKQHDSLHAFILVSMDKASTLLCCTHAECCYLHYDSQSCDVGDLSMSRSTLVKSGAELLNYLTRQPNPLYRVDAAASVWVLSRDWVHPCCAAPHPEDVKHCLSAPGPLVQVSLKKEAAPSIFVGKEAWAQAMGTQVISVEDVGPSQPPTSQGQMGSAATSAAHQRGGPSQQVHGSVAPPGESSSLVKKEPQQVVSSALVLLDDDQDTEAPCAPTKKARLSRKARREIRQDRTEGKARLLALGIDYHKSFQPKHAYKMEKDHSYWSVAFKNE